MEGIVPERERSRGMVVDGEWAGLFTRLRSPELSNLASAYPGPPPGSHLFSMASPDELIDTLRELVTPASLPHDAAAVNIRAMALISRLKSLNRAANNATRVHKDITAEARLDMDQSHLQLQNLLYEKRHLEREIEKCRQFAYVSSSPSGLQSADRSRLQFRVPGRTTIRSRRFQTTSTRRQSHRADTSG